VSDAAEDVIGVIRAGARGYVTKTISGPELADAIRRVAEGDVVSSRRRPASFSTPSRIAQGHRPTQTSTSLRPANRRSSA